MDYHYESLLDERFQMLCQSLLTREYPGVQCYPVGMPDGGRDATAPEPGGRIVFQVKYARNPSGIKDPLKWIIAAIDGEVEKVRRLAERGATSFVLITNVPGTSHLDTGRMDKVQKHLDAVLPISGICWWRDDLDRRLDGNFDLKLKYPSLLSGADIVRVLWEATGTGQDQQRRSHALRSYFADQSLRDSKVRFKQADLSPSPIFDLFIDVPAIPRKEGKRFLKTDEAEYQRTLLSIAQSREYSSNQIFLEEGLQDEPVLLFGFDIETGERTTHSVGAASLILSHAFSHMASRVVLEGAPGQGKSTFAQYIAQVHRTRILRTEEIDKIPLQDVTSPLMMPFKIELRDLATWLKGIDPWAPGERTAHGRPRSLESALAAHVERYSGGVSFDVSDLLFVMREASSLVILDALDEVADLDDRQQVVDEVTEAATRLESCNADLKIVITSRPTAVAGSPTFKGSDFFYLTLAAIHPTLAIQYTRKWAKARDLDDADLGMLLTTLEQKLKAPHMAELAKNTMQLSILLILTHLRGSTLPDKRTELYDAYIDVFLNREAEKDKTVRENRELLIKIHRYLGYYLHARAEVEGTTGRLSIDELREVLADFLERETSSSPSMQRRVTELLDALLTGVVERVVALVSRVEGTYEFEVQPLREYFAAKYLYETAPYAPATRRQPGTKPERFEGIAPNPYWMNVTRFFAGCFSEGELLDLADRTARLIEECDPEDAAYPRTLALCLLQDWVFTQSTPSMNRLLGAVFDKPGIRWASSQNFNSTRSAYGSGASVELSPTAGYENLVDHLWPLVAGGAVGEALGAVCLILRKQPKNALLADMWHDEAVRKDSSELSHWFRVGNWIGVFESLDVSLFLGILNRISDDDRDYALAAYLQGGGVPAELPMDILHRAVRAIMNGAGEGDFRLSMASLGMPIFRASDPALFIHSGGTSNYWRHLLNSVARESFPIEKEFQAYSEYMKVFQGLLRDQESISFDQWRSLLAAMRNSYGKTWREYSLANIAVSAKDASERGAGASNLFDEEQPLLDRLRNARRRARQSDWWESQYHQASDVLDRGMWVLAVFSWVRPEVLQEIATTFDRAVRELDDSTYGAVLEASRLANVFAKNSRSIVSFSVEELDRFGWRTLAIMQRRLVPESRARLESSFLKSRSKDYLAGSVFLGSITVRILNGEQDFNETMRLLSSASRRGIIARVDSRFKREASGRFRNENRSHVIRNSWDLPSLLVAFAHSGMSTRRRFRPVMEIARSGNWFAR